MVWAGTCRGRSTRRGLRGAPPARPSRLAWCLEHTPRTPAVACPSCWGLGAWLGGLKPVNFASPFASSPSSPSSPSSLLSSLLGALPSCFSSRDPRAGAVWPMGPCLKYEVVQNEGGPSRSGRSKPKPTASPARRPSNPKTRLFLFGGARGTGCRATRDARRHRRTPSCEL
jgi:hypothetical protein